MEQGQSGRLSPPLHGVHQIALALPPGKHCMWEGQPTAGAPFGPILAWLRWHSHSSAP
jgi:hypothetical protein